MPVDEDTLELVERRLAERIESRVRPRIFFMYTMIGGAILAVLGYFGYDLIKETREGAERYAREAVAPAAEKARVTAEEANAATLQALAMTRFVNDWIADQSKKLADTEQEMRQQFATLRGDADKAQQQLLGLADEIRKHEETLATQRERADEFYAGQGNLQKLKDEFVVLTEQLKLLEARVSAIPDAPRTEEFSNAELRESANSPAQVEIQQIIERSAEILPTLEGREPVAYLQFAGVERDIAQQLSAALAERKFRNAWGGAHSFGSGAA